MSDIATLKEMKCPKCGSEELLIRGVPHGVAKEAAGFLLAGSLANVVASKKTEKNGQTEPVAPIAFYCKSCKNKFESLPLIAPEEDVLSEPCTITFTRLKSMAGCAVVQVVYLNGVICGPVKNGQSITIETSNRYNTIYVTDQYGAAFPDDYHFEATPGGHVEVNFKRKFV